MKTVIQNNVLINVNEVSHDTNNPSCCQYEFSAIGLEEAALKRALEGLFGLSVADSDGKGLDGLAVWTREIINGHLLLKGGLQVTH